MTESAPREPRREGRNAAATRVGGVVLAAGGSSRMAPAHKLLLPFQGRTVVETVVETAHSAGLDPVVTVTGHGASDVERALARTRTRLVRNALWEVGRGSSLAAGLRELASAPEVEAAVVLLADEPGLPRAAILRIVDAWRAERPAIVRAVYLDRPGHPVLIDRTHFAATVREAARRRGEWTLAAVGDVVEVPLGVPAPVDVDTPEAYRAALARQKDP